MWLQQHLDKMMDVLVFYARKYVSYIAVVEQTE